MLLTFAASDKPARAQAAPSGFSITPFYQSIDLKKDQASAPFTINVKNTTAAPAVFRVSVLDFGTLDESGGVAFLGASDNLKYGLASWVNLSNDTLVLAPGEERQVDGTIENRESLSPGGHYGAVFFKIDDNGGNTADSQSDSIAFDPSLASLLFVRKTGGETYGLNLDSFEASKNIFTLPDQIRLRFQNTGNVHVVPRGTVEIFDPTGRMVAKSIINSESGIILPETFRLFPSKFMPISFAYLPGRYTMAIDYRYDGQDNFTTRKTIFFFVPLNFVGLVVLVIGLMVAVHVIHKKKKIKQK
ncbi:MAG: hypothetical protein P4L62_02700 [Candidatus Pacebacteria bacterium]|nr:hypothetical protein [Candidatus Paceibacterota bacterium]